MTVCRPILNTLRVALLRWRFIGVLIPALALKELLKARTRNSFSQFGEDSLLQQICPPNGYYIDVGSGRPVSGSNTFLLYKKGWRGTLIDPIRQNILLSFLIRPRDKKIQAAIGNPGVFNFFQLFPYEYSTFSDVRAQDLVNTNQAQLISKDKINVIGIETLFGSPVNGCLLLCIDIEGMDLQVLTRFPFEIQKPDVICVEETLNDTDSGFGIHDFLQNKGYRLFRRLAPSAIYVLIDSKRLKI